jgi:hypothetical protein
MRSFGILIMFTCLASLLPMHACPACLDERGGARPTLLDQIQKTDQVVIALPVAGRPNRHIVAYVLKGPASLKDKQIRTEAFGKPLARLVIPASSLLTWHAKSKSWIKRVTLTLTQERFLKQAVKAPSTNTQRLAFFRPYLHHLDPAIQEIATKEWARAPYKALRVSSTLLDRTVIRKLLEKENPNALHYVLLGLCGNINDDKAFLKRALRSPKAFAAKLTAHLEMHGKPALSSLVTRYFKSSKHSADEVEAAITAIGVHGTDNTTISRDTAQEALKSLFHHQPKQAAHAAPFFEQWRDWSVTEEFEALESSDPKVQAFLKAASQARDF